MFIWVQPQKMRALLKQLGVIRMFEGKKTYIGLFVAALPTLVGFLGYNIGPEGASELSGILGPLVDNVEEVIVSVGLLIGWYGRKVTKG